MHRFLISFYFYKCHLDDGVVRQTGSSSRYDRDGRSSLSGKGDNNSRPHRHSREEFAPKELRHSIVLNRSYDLESPSVAKDTSSSRLLHQRELIKPPHLSSYSHQRKQHSESPRSSSGLNVDRSRPDGGEVSEKFQTNRYTDYYEKKMHDLAREREKTAMSLNSYADKPPPAASVSASSSRDYGRYHDQNQSQNLNHNVVSSRKYVSSESHGRDTLLTSERSDLRPYSSGAMISSQGQLFLFLFSF